MSNYQVQSLDEDVVFLPVTESSPEFLHCEKERQAVERLLCGGPEAFYSFISAEGSGCFLAPEEVSQITGWAQEYRFNSLQAQKGEDGDDGASEMYFSSTYFPSCSDTPVPCLQLGWPENNSWVGKEQVSVYTSPPPEGQPPVREVIRHHLQKATRVIAIVTDRLTDGAVIGDLHDAASRGVPVYIILNQRSIRENFTLNRLRHPNMQVRVLGGKTFCSRTGGVVIGEMKDKFLLVDLETVIHGSYSLTWTDAHLHRQLITVLQGPVVELFDKEFRILYAASLPIPDMWRAAFVHADVINRLKDFSDRRFPRNLPMEPEITAPPSPPADFTLDWEAMGVVQRDSIFPESLADRHEDPVPEKTMLQNNVQLDLKAPIMDVFSQNRNQPLDWQMVCEKNAQMTNNLLEKPTTFKNTKPYVPAHLHLTSPETSKMEERRVDQTFFRQLAKENNAHLDDKTAMRLGGKERGQIFSALAHFPFQRNQHVKTEKVFEKESSTEENSWELEHAVSSRKPLILRVPQSESFSSLSDIKRRLETRKSAEQRQESKASATELSSPMMDLKVTAPKQDTTAGPESRFKTSCFDQDHLTPAFALMKKRNDEMKSILYKTPNTLLSNSRPRTTSYGGLIPNWRRSLAEKEEELE